MTQRGQFPGIVLSALVAVLCAGVAKAAVIDPEVETFLQTRSAGSEVAVIVTFHQTVDPLSLNQPDRRERRAALLRRLNESAEVMLAPVRRLAEARGGKDVTILWAAQALAVTAGPELVRELASLPGVTAVRRDTVVQVFHDGRGGRVPQSLRNGLPATRKPRTGQIVDKPVVTVPSRAGASATFATSATPEWNLSVVKAPDLWAHGVTGRGVVVASLDTGVDGEHPDLIVQYRGGANSWYDPHGEHQAPADHNGHGTQAMSLAVGRAGGHTAIGMAPDARWIAAKLFNDAGYSRESVLHQSLQWVLDPDGNSETDDAPDVVNLSWVSARQNLCSLVFQHEFDALRASGIAVVIAAGNAGPGPSTSVSPANNPHQLSVGSVNRRLEVSPFSSQGPSACGGGLFPAVLAPGEQVLAADLSFGGLPNYTTVSGTSFAAPHVTGAIALLVSAVPGVELAVIESALSSTAVSVAMPGGLPQAGQGTIDSLAAYRVLLMHAGMEPAAQPSGRPGMEQEAVAHRTMEP